MDPTTTIYSVPILHPSYIPGLQVEVHPFDAAEGVRFSDDQLVVPGSVANTGNPWGNHRKPWENLGKP